MAHVIAAQTFFRYDLIHCRALVPVWPIAAFRVRRGETTAAAIPLVASHISTSYQVRGEEPPAPLSFLLPLILLLTLSLTALKTYVEHWRK